MKQIFLLGSSSVYGVGSVEGGWAGMLKTYVHKQMFADGGVGEKYEVFNLGKSGATIDYVLDSLDSSVSELSRDVPKMAIVNVGGNNSKAEETPENFVSTPEEYEKEVERLLVGLQDVFDEVIFVSSGYIDESKTNPKFNPLTGGQTYHSNERRQLFNEVTESACARHGVTYVGLMDVNQDEWLSRYIYEDGMHANDDGYRLFFDLLKRYVDAFLEGSK